MKKYLSFLLLLCSVLMYSQKIAIKKELSVLNTSSHCVGDVCFSVLSSKNKKEKGYEYQLYLSGKYVGSLMSKFSKELALYHVYNNKLVLLFSGKKKISKTKEVYSRYLKSYTMVTFDMSKNGNFLIKDLHSLHTGRSDIEFSYDTYSCLFAKEKNTIRVFTFTDTVSVSYFNLPEELLNKFPELETNDLKVINTEKYSENIGVPMNRLYRDEDTIYLTYMLSKYDKNIICKLTKKENSFKWSGYNEIDFSLSETNMNYNSYLLNGQFYFVENKDKQAYLNVLDLDENTSFKYDLSKLAFDGVINKSHLDEVLSSLYGRIISVVVHDQENSKNKIVKISSIPIRDSYNPFFFDQMFMQQQMIQPRINISIPGGFYMREFPSLSFLNKKTKTVDFLITESRKIIDYNDEKPLFKEHDYRKSKNLLKEYLENTVKFFKKKNISFDWLTNGDLYYTYYDSKSRRVLVGVKKKE